jgi:hypothetical protein
VKTDETGGQKITTEPYLVDAYRIPAEVESNEEMAAYSVKSLKSRT